MTQKLNSPSGDFQESQHQMGSKFIGLHPVSDKNYRIFIEFLSNVSNLGHVLGFPPLLLFPPGGLSNIQLKLHGQLQC